MKVDLSAEDKQVVDHVLGTIYKSPEVLSQDRYVDQAAIINRRLWEQSFHKDVRQHVPQIVSLEQEIISAGLLEKDLANKNSLMSSILFDPQLRQAVVKELEGVPGCWREANWKGVAQNGSTVDHFGLAQLADTSLDITPEKRREDAEKAMTHFFWGIDENGKTYPLAIAETGGQDVLRRVDKLHLTEDIPFTPEAIELGLQNQTLMPSLMVTFGLIQFARAYNCLGGFMQEEYLINMQHGLEQALEKTGRRDWAKNIKQAKKVGYAVGMPLVITQDSSSGNLRTAGPLDMIRHGGLTQGELERIQHATLEHEYQMGLPSIARIIFGNNLDADLLSQAQQEVSLLWQQYLVQI